MQVSYFTRLEKRGETPATLTTSNMWRAIEGDFSDRRRFRVTHVSFVTTRELGAATKSTEFVRGGPPLDPTDLAELNLKFGHRVFPPGSFRRP